jgi:hypothetical protein
VDEHRDQHPDTTDEAYARLRAADPAADARVDTAALRAEVARRTGEEPAAEDAVVTPLAPHRRARWLQVAAVGVGAALVAGAGGFAVGARGDDGSGVTAAAPITMSGGAQPATETAAGGAAAADLRIAPGFGGRSVFSSAGLGDDGGSERAWALDAAAVFSAETAARVAGVLGVPGDPAQEYGAWTVGPQDGSAPNLTLQPDGAASISYYDPARDPWSCVASAPDQPDGGSTSGTVEPFEAEPRVVEPGLATLDPGLVGPGLPSGSAPVCDTLGAAPTGDAAIAQVRDLLATLGVDPAGFQYEVADNGEPADARAATVLAAQVLDDQQTGVTWNVTLVADGVQSLYGSLAPLVDLGDYPVVGAETAVERLNDPRFASGYGGVMPLARAGVVDDARAAVEVPETAGPTVPPTARPGSPIAWPVQQVTITGARLGLTQVTQADGATLLVPAYELTDDAGSVWSVVAVDEAALDLAG